MSAREARGQDEDEPLALAALARAGVETEVVCWDDPEVDWSRFDRAVLRSTWDYHRHLDAFLTWLDEVDGLTELVNPLALVRWSLDKHYLADLEGAGVPITPTVYIAPGEQSVFPEGDFVVKPAVGAGSQEAASYGAD
ncbi:MAG: glutathione synthetase, partial [Actinomyces sp.]|nr:glutathione synthetase [Actinomyces sp.]